MYTIVGFSRRAGDFEGRPYDNTMLYCQKVDPDPGVTGVEVEVIKVPTSAFERAGLKIGDSFMPYRDRYGRVVDIIIR